jgi:hypothetical protein
MMPDKLDPADDQPKSRRTEVVVREYNEDGELETETITVTIERTPAADEAPWPGQYL